jgi:hypothetical protein
MFKIPNLKTTSVLFTADQEWTKGFNGNNIRRPEVKITKVSRQGRSMRCLTCKLLMYRFCPSPTSSIY